MSDINANIVVETNTINVVVDNTPIQVTPNAIAMNIYSAGYAVAGGTAGQLQYNNNGALAGAANTVVANGNVKFTNISNLKINGGATGYFLQTDGAGDLTWAQGTANITGNGTAAGSNNQIQLSDGTGNFKVGGGFSFDPTSNVLSAPGNGAFAGNVSANYFVGNGNSLYSLQGSNIVGTVANANYSFYSGNATIANTANVAYSVSGSNVSGQVANALVAGTVYTSVQPNIISVGTLANLTVGGLSSIQEVQEKLTANATGATGTINYDLLTQAIIYQTGNATGNVTLNFRGNSSVTLNSLMNTYSSMTCSFINTTGTTPYVVTNIQIDGTPITPVWTLPGSAGTGTPSGVDSYTFNILKTTSGVFKVLASRVGYV